MAATTVVPPVSRMGFYGWGCCPRAGPEVSDAKRLKALEDGNAKLRSTVSRWARFRTHLILSMFASSL